MADRTVIPFPNSGHSIRTSPERRAAEGKRPPGAPEREGAKISADGLNRRLPTLRNQLLRLSERLTAEAKALPIGHPRRAAIAAFIDDAAKACAR